MLVHQLKGIRCVFIKENYITVTDENDPLFEYNKGSLGHNRTNGAVYSKINWKVEICSVL